MRFFFDNCISPRYVRALRPVTEPQDVDLVHLRDRFHEEMRDEQWLRRLGEDGGWLVLSGDLRIARSIPERKAWEESGLTVFFCDEGWCRQPHWSQFTALVRWWPSIVLTARNNAAGATVGYRGYKLILQSNKIQDLPTR